MVAASPQGHTTWSASASSGKDGKGCRRACKKTRLACLLGRKVVSVPIQYTPRLRTGHFARCLCLGLIAFLALFLLHPCLCNEQGAILKLADGIRQVHVSVPVKQVVESKRGCQRGGDFVGGSKSGADIASSIPDHLGMIFQVHQQAFFHQTTKRRPSGSGLWPPNFQLGIQPEILSPAILNRSTPRIPFSDMGSSLHP